MHEILWVSSVRTERFHLPREGLQLLLFLNWNRPVTCMASLVAATRLGALSSESFFLCRLWGVEFFRL
jgi:hypothetical protein